ncbi:MAG: hypothetical protein R3Y09_06595 [Clostridia bacterium]
MDENKTSIWGILILVFLFFIVFTGNGFGNRVEAAEISRSVGDCHGTSNCQVEKQTIINTATTQNLIQTEAEKTRERARDDKDEIMAQASRIHDANQAEKLFDAKLRINSLEQEKSATAQFTALFMQNKDCCCELNRRIDGLPMSPPFYAQGFVTTGQSIPVSNGFGFGVA